MARFAVSDRVMVKTKNRKEDYGTGTVVALGKQGAYTTFTVVIDGTNPPEVVTDKHNRFYHLTRWTASPRQRTGGAFPV